MSLILNQSLFLQTMVAACFVMAGVMFKNGGKQLAKNQSKKQGMTEQVGIVLFVLGWLGIIYATSTGYNNKTYLTAGASLTILVSVMVIMYNKKKHGDNPPEWVKIFNAGFIIGWLVLGYAVAINKPNPALLFGLGAAVLVLLSMVLSLPWQRKNNVIDGPGMALFALGWVSLSVANSV